MLIKFLSVSISYITSSFLSSTRVVFKGESFVRTSFIAIALEVTLRVATL